MAHKKLKPYKQFCFVDCAIGGAHNRNNVYHIDDLPVTADMVDAYTTMFLFQQEYKEHVESMGSVRGADQFAVWSPYVWFDIDAGNLDDATTDMQTLLRGLQSMEADAHTVVFFSGAKGYHIGVDSRLFGLVPSTNLPDQMRVICTQLASLFSITIDACIYNHNRLWRIPNTVHSKTKLRKIQLPFQQALSLSTAKICALANKLPKTAVCGYTISPTDVVEPSLSRFVDEAETGKVTKSDGWAVPPLAGRQLQIVQGGLNWLLAQGVKRGNRDNEALLRAAECRKLGFNSDKCLELLEEWNELNDPPLAVRDLTRIITSAYQGAGYDFGTNSESLRVAREHGEKQLNTLVKSPVVGSDDDEPRPRSFSELLAMGDDNFDAPEEVGSWISWRKYITLLVGDPKLSGKSTLCTWEAVAALKKGYRVLWVSPDEARRDIVYRFHEANITQYGEQLMIAGDGDVPRDWKKLGEWIVKQQADLVILDSIHSLFPLLDAKGKVPESSETSQWHLLTGALRPIAIDGNVAVVWIHHANKGDGKASGSVGIVAAVDVVVRLIPLSACNGHRRKLSFIGRRINKDCALDYVDEKTGYKEVKDWKTEMKNQPVSIIAEMRIWVMSWIGEHITQSTTFTSGEIRDAYRADKQQNPDDSNRMGEILAGLVKDGMLHMGGSRTGHRKYTVTNTAAFINTTASDLMEDNDEE